jgi:hypothetical protein
VSTSKDRDDMSGKEDGDAALHEVYLCEHMFPILSSEFEDYYGSI